MPESCVLSEMKGECEITFFLFPLFSIHEYEGIFIFNAKQEKWILADSLIENLLAEHTLWRWLRR